MNHNAANNNDPGEERVTGQRAMSPHRLDPEATPPRQSPMAGWFGSSAADLLGPGLVLATQDQGYTAALNGDHLDTCPWRSAKTDRECALRQMWIRGYAAGRTDLRAARDPDRPPR